MLTLARFKAMTDSYGADPSRWPEALRGEAEALLLASAEARAYLESQRAVDDAISAAAAERRAQLERAGEPGAAVARLRASVAARIRAGETVRRSWRLGLPGLIAIASAAVVTGLIIGSLYGSPAAPDDLLSALVQPPVAGMPN